MLIIVSKSIIGFVARYVNYSCSRSFCQMTDDYYSTLVKEEKVMKKLLVLLCVAVGVVMSGIETKAATTVDGYYLEEDISTYEWAVVDAYYRYEEAYKMIELVNEYRVSQGKTALQTNDNLMKIAMQRALEVEVSFQHVSPYIIGAVTDYVTISKTDRAVAYKVGLINAVNIQDYTFPYAFKEVITGGSMFIGGTEEDLRLTAGSALQDFKDSSTHNAIVLNNSVYSVGVGFVNNTCVVCLFTKDGVLSTAFNTTLVDYNKIEVVPFSSSYRSTDRTKLINSKYLRVVKATKELADAEAAKLTAEKEEQEKEEAQIEAEKKAVQTTKTTLYSVTKKRSGNNTKVTVKFSKVKGYKYQVQYSFKKNFKSKKTSKWYGTVKKNGTHKKTFTIRGNNSKNVWVRVRAYKVIDGKKVYGKWSSKIKVKTVKKK